MFMLKKLDFNQWGKFTKVLVINMLEELNKLQRKDKHIINNFQYLINIQLILQILHKILLFMQIKLY